MYLGLAVFFLSIILLVWYSSLPPEKIECPETNRSKSYPIANGLIFFDDEDDYHQHHYDSTDPSSHGHDLSAFHRNASKSSMPMPSYLPLCETSAHDLIGIPIVVTNTTTTDGSSPQPYRRMVSVCGQVYYDPRNISDIVHKHPPYPILVGSGRGGGEHSDSLLQGNETTIHQRDRMYVNQLFVYFGKLIKYDLVNTRPLSCFSEGGESPTGNKYMNTDEDEEERNCARLVDDSFVDILHRDEYTHVPWTAFSASSRTPLRRPINHATPLLDMSFLYGSSLEEQELLRSFKNGFLRVSYSTQYTACKRFTRTFSNNEDQKTTSTTEPTDVNHPNEEEGDKFWKSMGGGDDYGDDDDDIHSTKPLKKGALHRLERLCSLPPRNETSGEYICGNPQCNDDAVMVALQSIWIREHNYWARFEKLSHGDRYDDEDLFQRARLRVAAQFEHITFHSWFSVLLGENPFLMSKSSSPSKHNRIPSNGRIQCYNYRKRDPRVYVEGNTAFSIYPTMVADSLYLRHWEAPYNILETKSTEWLRKNPDYLSFSEKEGFQDGDAYILESMLSGLVRQRAEEYDPYIVDSLRNPSRDDTNDDEDPPLVTTIIRDIVVEELFRSRDHSVPSYAEVYFHVHGKPLERWDQISTSPEIVRRLQSAFGADQGFYDMDLWTGLLSEDHYQNALVGKTTYIILRHQFQTLRNSDWHFYLWDASVRPWLSSVFATSFDQIIERNTFEFALQTHESYCPHHWSVRDTGSILREQQHRGNENNLDPVEKESRRMRRRRKRRDKRASKRKSLHIRGQTDIFYESCYSPPSPPPPQNHVSSPPPQQQHSAHSITNGGDTKETTTLV